MLHRASEHSLIAIVVLRVDLLVKRMTFVFQFTLLAAQHHIFLMVRLISEFHRNLMINCCVGALQVAVTVLAL